MYLSLKRVSLYSSLCLALIAPATLSIATPIAAQSATPLLTQQPPSPDSEQQQVVAEQFLDLVADGQYEAARQYLHPTLAEEWTAEVIEQRWQAFQNRTGSFVQRLESKAVDQLVLITVEFTEVTDDAIFIFDNNQRIVGVDFPMQPAQIVEE